jgi:hypothetical protein
MKLISTDPPPGFVKQKVCGWCGATMEYIPLDIKFQSAIFPKGGGRGRPSYEYVNCPQCEGRVRV